MSFVTPDPPPSLAHVPPTIGGGSTPSQAYDIRLESEQAQALQEDNRSEPEYSNPRQEGDHARLCDKGSAKIEGLELERLLPWTDRSPRLWGTESSLEHALQILIVESQTITTTNPRRAKCHLGQQLSYLHPPSIEPGYRIHRNYPSLSTRRAVEPLSTPSAKHMLPWHWGLP